MTGPAPAVTIAFSAGIALAPCRAPIRSAQALSKRIGLRIGLKGLPRKIGSVNFIGSLLNFLIFHDDQLKFKRIFLTFSAPASAQ